MTKDALAEVTEDPKDEVPRLRYLRHKNDKQPNEEPVREPVYETIPYDRWERIKATNEAMRKIKRDLGSKTDTNLIDVDVVHDGKTRSVGVLYKIKERDGEINSPEVNFSNLTGEIADEVTVELKNGSTVEGIPVKVKKKEIIEQDVSCEYDVNRYTEYYEDIPGGCNIGSNYRCATMCTPAYDNSSDKDVLISAAHNFFGPEYEDFSSTAWQPNPANYGGGNGSALAGEVTDYVYWRDGDSGKRDAARIELDFTRDVKYRLADDGGGYKNESVGGIVFSDTIEDKMGDSSYKLTRQGSNSGTGKGMITNYDPDDKEFKIDVTSKKGDSGGPVFKNIWGATLIAGITRAEGGKTYLMEDAETQLGVVI
jgi:hypothetical protein